MTKKQKIKNVIKKIAFCSLGLLVAVLGVFGFKSIKTANTNIAGAYTTSIIPGTIPSASDLRYVNSSYEMTLYNVFSNNISFGSNMSTGSHSITSTPSYENLASNVSAYIPVDNSTFDYTRFINSYYDDFNAVTNFDTYSAVYYYFSIRYIESANNAIFYYDLTNLKLNVIDKNTGIISNTYNSSDYVRSSFFSFNGFSIVVLNLTSLSSQYDLTLSQFLTNYSLNFTFNVTNGANTYPNFSQGIFYSTWMPNLIKYMFGGVSTSLPSISYDDVISYLSYLNYSSLNIYYNWFNGSNITDYWQQYYENYYNNELNSSYQNGYNVGKADGIKLASDLPGLVSGFASLPFGILSGFLNFDLLGFNIYSLVLSIITLLVIVWLIRRLFS